MALLRIKALPSSTGAPYYRRAGRCFVVGQTVEVEVSAEDESLLRASARLRVETITPASAESPPAEDQVEEQAPKRPKKSRSDES